VIADHTANPAFVAADLLSQAEHGVDSQVVLVTVALPDATIGAIEREVDLQARALSRVDILRESIPKSLVIKTATVQEAFDFSNDYAPEHLILHLEDAPDHVARVQNAGSVFVGAYSPERLVWLQFLSRVRADRAAAAATTPQARTTRCRQTATRGSSAA
jgi:phosphoribosyl-ATP pyrophosphohydrolase/phosphoribosyl-AMP cyclohydrolase/histidinol dehydrogenase